MLTIVAVFLIAILDPYRAMGMLGFLLVCVGMAVFACIQWRRLGIISLLVYLGVDAMLFFWVGSWVAEFIEWA